MMTLLNLFGRSPFAPLESHMEKVSECVYMLTDLFDALQSKDYDLLEKIVQKIRELEHEADLIKNDIRNHLPKTLFLPVNRGNLLEILTLQDSIADRAEDIAVITTFKRIEMIDSLKEDFREFLAKNIETFNGARSIINELQELLETSFSGVEAEKVRNMVAEVARQEHETDIIQHKLIKGLIMAENKMTYTTFYLWQKIFETLGSISNLAENLADRIRMTLELK
ncbi:MAG: hypothetical protein K940chlam7_00327 [Chlamydiae bacterium]|nr:hypothetical protein [Chlamydiota bacterium]